MTKRPRREIFSKAISGQAVAVSISSSSNVAFFFIRNVLLARILAPADFGVAVVILTVSSAIDVLSDLGWDKFLIQSDHAEPSRAAAQGVVHLLRMGLGLVMATAIALLSAPLASLMGAPHANLAIAALAVPVLARSACHIDYKHQQREMRFGGEALVESVRSIIELVAGVAAALILHSYWAMTIAITCGAISNLVVSHLIARDRFHARWSSELGRSVLAFGSPLVVNNAFVYVAGQGDRLLIGAKFGVQQLATYATALTLVAGPQAVLSRGLMMVALPVLSRARAVEGQFDRSFTLIGAVAVAAAALASIPMILFGTTIVHLAFGRHYQPSAMLCGLLAVSQSINILRSWAICGLVAYARTRYVPLANGVRFIGFAGALAVASAHGSVEAVAACLAGGEALGLAAALFWHARMVRSIPRLMIVLLSLLTACWVISAVAEQLEVSTIPRICTFIVIMFATLGISLGVGWRARSSISAAQIA